jgi:hypothetical protein
LLKDNVKCGEPVSCYNEHVLRVNIIYVSYFSPDEVEARIDLFEDESSFDYFNSRMALF